MKRYLDLMMKALLCAMFMCVFAACSDDDEPDGNPSGTKSIVMNNGISGERTEIWPDGARDVDNHFERKTFFMTSTNNFSSYGAWRFVSLGEVEGLSSITNIPQSGWLESVRVEPGCGYIGSYLWDEKEYYFRIYIVDYVYSTSNQIIGAKVKYARLKENGGGNGSSVNTKYLAGKWTFQKGIYNISGQKVTITKNQLKEYAAQAGVSIWDETLTFSGSKVNGVGYEVVGNKFRYTGGIYDEGYEDMTITIPTLTGSQLVLRYDLTKMIGISYIADLYYSK